MSLVERIASTILGRRLEIPGSLARDLVPPGVTLREGRLVPWIGGVFGGMGRPAAAVTLRRTIVVNPGVPLTPSLLAHELTHVRQWRDDFLFPLRYTLSSLRHGYHNNPYELEARQVAASQPRPPTERNS